MLHTLFLSDVRCFYGDHTIPIKPITVFLGENSTGKSTLLALERLAWDVAYGDPREDIFNQDPFLLGAYDQIASYRGGKAGRAKSFKIGLSISFVAKTRQSIECKIIGKFEPIGGQPALVEWVLSCGELSVTIKFKEEEKDTIIIQSSLGTAQGSTRYSVRRHPMSVLMDLAFFSRADPRNTGVEIQATSKSLAEVLLDKDVKTLNEIYQRLGRGRRMESARPYAFSPIRTEPKRTYDPVSDQPQPEGTHVPMVLAKTYASNKSGWEKLRQSMVDFGKSSGLFDDITIRRKGAKESDPFQIAIKLAGPAFNLVDVGYGVSQVLPIVVDVLRGAPGRSYLLQQPEVHLHPRAQAELATFLMALAKHDGKTFVVETHSDYFVDRIRQNIKEAGTLKADDVSLIYLEKTKKGVRTYPISLDDQGNLLDVPATYRKFFLDEEKRLLGL